MYHCCNSLFNLLRVESVNSSLRVLEESCLVPFLQQLLENDSLLDVDRHAALYTSVFKVRLAWPDLHPTPFASRTPPWDSTIQ